MEDRQPQPTAWESVRFKNDEAPRPPPIDRPTFPEVAAEGRGPLVDALVQTVARLSALVCRRAAAEGADVLDWLARVAGDPRTYDALDAERTGVCVRVLPMTYAQLQQTQRQIGLRTMAEAWKVLAATRTRGRGATPNAGIKRKRRTPPHAVTARPIPHPTHTQADGTP